MAALFRLFFVAIVVLGLGAPKAWADSDTKRASKHVVDGDRLKKQAEAAQNKGRDKMAKRLFAAAAFEYVSAYDLVPHPLMLYNLAQVARLTGDKTRAYRLYKKFLKEQPTGEAANFARSYVRILKRTVELEGEVEEEGEGENEEGEADGSEEESEEESEEGEVDPETDNNDITGQSSKPAKDDPGKTKRYAGLGLSATGLLSVLVGTKFGLDAKSISTTLSNHNTAWTDKEIQLDKDGDAAAKKMLIFTGLGAAALVGGGLLYYLGKSESSEDKQEALLITPQADGESIGIGLAGRF